MRSLLWVVPVLLLVAGGWLYRSSRPDPLPPGLAGTLVFVSDRSGTDSLYFVRLPGGEVRRLATLLEPAEGPCLSPDGRQVAFSMGGRIGLVSVATGDVRILTLGVDWRDSSPSWRPDGKGLVIVARRSSTENGDIHALDLDSPGGPVRRPLTETLVDETTPLAGPDGSFVVFVREDHVFRMELADGRTRRITGGFRRSYHPRFLPSGRLLVLWSQEKQFGIDVMDANGKSRETLAEDSAYYRTVAPSPDGRFLAVTFTFDLRFHPADALKLRQTEEVRLLDAHGNRVGVLAQSWRYANHSPDWGR